MTKLVQDRIHDQDLPTALVAAIQFDEDMEFTPSLLKRVSNEKEKDELLRTLSGWGRTLFALAASSNMRLIMEFLMKDVIKDDGVDNVFFYTTSDYSFRTGLGHMVDDTLNIDIFQRALNSLEPKMRLQQLLWEEKGGINMFHRSKSRDFQKKLGELVMTELQDVDVSDITDLLFQSFGHQGHCEDINILNQLFDHGMTIQNLDYLELILSKTPENLKYKLLVNYEGGWQYNRIKDNVMMKRSHQKKSQLMLDLLLKHVDNEQVKRALRDVDNPEQHPLTVIQMVCDLGDTKKFRAILTIYENANIPIEDDLFAVDHQGGSLLHRAMAKVSEIPQHIFRVMKSDEMKMKMINQRRRSDGKCLLDIAQNNKRFLKGLIAGIVGNVEKTKLDHTNFIPYFQWLIKEKELDAIKALVAVFNDSIDNFISAQTDSKQNAFHIACANTRGSYQLIGYLLSMVKDEELRSYLTAKDNAANAPLRYGSTACRLFVLNYVWKREQKLVKELILDSKALLIVECLSSARELAAIFKFCDGDVLLDRSLIVQLSFGVEWSSDNDNIRELIVDTVNERTALESSTDFEIPQNGNTSVPAGIGRHVTLAGLVTQSDDFGLVPEAGGLMKSISANAKMQYVDPFLYPVDFWPIEDPETGNSSLALCLMADNRKLLDLIIDKLDLENKLAIHLTAYSNYNGSTYLHMAATRKTKRNEYCSLIVCHIDCSECLSSLLDRDISPRRTRIHINVMIFAFYTAEEVSDAKE